MSRYRLLREVREDLKEIARYIARDNPSAAKRLRETFLEKLRLLARSPLLGEARSDLLPDARIFSAGNYVIVYRARRGGIDVLRIIHGARDIAAVLRGSG